MNLAGTLNVPSGKHSQTTEVYKCRPSSTRKLESYQDLNVPRLKGIITMGIVLIILLDTGTLDLEPSSCSP